MKIGLITFHDTTNFGSILQTYGLYKAIENLGHECFVIDYQCESIVARELPKFHLTVNVKSLVSQILFLPTKKRKHRKLLSFLSTHAKISQPLFRNTVHEIDGEYDKYFVGSDIVWGLDITQGDTAYFLDFIKCKQQKFAFASSIGSPWTKEDKNRVKPLLNEFQHIAVREDESADWVEELTLTRPDVVCDPTMLLESNEWERIKSDKYASIGRYVFVYFNDSANKALDSAKRYAKMFGTKVLYVNYGRSIAGVQSVKPTSIEDFLSLIFYAEHIFTASYHGMLFSTYFRKQFSYFNRAHKSRMNTLARKLNVMQCNGETIDVANLPTIDYHSVGSAISAYRDYSLERLNYMLNL